MGPVRLPTSILTERQWVSVVDELKLSERQRDVLGCLLNGDSEKQIAARLSISPATVHTHLKRLHAKLGVQNRASGSRARCRRRSIARISRWARERSQASIRPARLRGVPCLGDLRGRLSAPMLHERRFLEGPAGAIARSTGEEPWR